MNKIIKYSTKAPEKKDDRVLRFIGSDESIDRDNERIMSSGWKLANYKKNPVIMLNHRHSDLPVAKAQRVWVSKKNKSLMFDIKFPEPEISSVGDTLYKLYSNGYMNATSVGFKPNLDKVEYGDGSEKSPRATFNEQELLELSLVSVPANPRALLTQKGIKDAIDNEVIDQVELGELEMLFDELFEPEIKAELIEDEDDAVEEELEALIDKIEKDLDEIQDDEDKIIGIMDDGVDGEGIKRWKRVILDQILINSEPFTKEDLEVSILDDDRSTEQTINEPVYCHECGKNINQDNSDGDYLEQLFDDFLKPKEVNKEDEKGSLEEELLNEYFDKE